MSETKLFKKINNSYIEITKDQLLIELQEANKSLEKEIKRLNNIINELENIFELERHRLVRETSNIYEDSLGKTRKVNEDIYDEITAIRNKLKELKEGNND